jgi:hypothetical protein
MRRAFVTFFLAPWGVFAVFALLTLASAGVAITLRLLAAVLR